MKTVYMDNNATTMVADEVFNAMIPYFKDYYGNPSSMHTFGSQIANKINIAREEVSDFLGVSNSEIIFTSCGTESNNTAVCGILNSNKDKKHIITTKVEHPAILNLSKHLAKNGYEVTELNVDKDGRLDLEELKCSIREDTALVTIMYANNETGVIFPIEEIGKIVKEKGAIFHCDAVQAVGKVDFNLSNSNIDLLSISGHKLHAPKGVGVLFVRKGIRIKPLLIGGHQESNKRAGTENVPYIVGIGKACQLAKNSVDIQQNCTKNLRDLLEKGISENVSNVMINGQNSDRLPNTSNISFEYVEGESILLLLSQAGVAASSGSACTSGSLEPSHVLTAMGVPAATAQGSVRFSLSKYSTEDDVNYVIEKIPPIIKRLREISPFCNT